MSFILCKNNRFANMIPIFMFDKYGKNLLRLMLGEGNPKELIEEAEKEALEAVDAS